MRSWNVVSGKPVNISSTPALPSSYTHLTHMPFCNDLVKPNIVLSTNINTPVSFSDGGCVSGRKQLGPSPLFDRLFLKSFLLKDVEMQYQGPIWCADLRGGISGELHHHRLSSTQPWPWDGEYPKYPHF